MSNYLESVIVNQKVDHRANVKVDHPGYKYGHLSVPVETVS
jgi:hypothetical protein